jgi:hypothetical protein
MQFPRVHIVFGHPITDLAEVGADVGEAGPGAQQVGGQGVPSLMRHVVAEVQVGNPFAEPAVEPLIGERDGAVMFAVGGRKQRQPGAFRAGGPVTMLGGEVNQGLALPLVDPDIRTAAQLGRSGRSPALTPHLAQRRVEDRIVDIDVP